METIIIVGIGLFLLILNITSLVAMAKTGRVLREHEGAYLGAKAARDDFEQKIVSIREVANQASGGLKTLRDDSKETAKILRDEILKTRNVFNEKLEETNRRFGATSERDLDGLRNYARAIDAALADRTQELAALMQEVRNLRARYERGVGVGVLKTDRDGDLTICLTNKFYFKDKNVDVKPERDAEKEGGAQE